MITFTTGDILSADTEAIVNTVNTVGIMGKGLALQFKRRYKSNYLEYKRACDLGQVQLGKMFVTRSPELSGPSWLINFPTKGHWKANSRLSDIDSGLDDLVRVIEELDIKSIAIPPLGAGNGGLSWPTVRERIHARLADIETRVVVYEPSSAAHQLAPEPVRLTRTRALVLSLMCAYSEQRRALEPWEDYAGASHLEIQKLMYFAARYEPGLKLDFSKGHYGPYSETVRKIVRDLEGWFVEGFGDGTDRSLDLNPIEVNDRGRIALQRWIDPLDPSVVPHIVKHVMQEIRGFEGAYPLEVLSSVAWAASENMRTVDDVDSYVKSWNARKGRLFTHAHIRRALQHVLA